MPDLLDKKKALYSHCLQLVQEKIDALNDSMKEVQASANEETKSSAGDKYETARAMAMLEKENLAKQQAEFLKQLKVLQSINSEKSDEKIGLGSLVKTSDGKSYFLSISLGPIVFDGETYLVISPVSPIGKLMSGKSVSDEISFGGRKFGIGEVR